MCFPCTPVIMPVFFLRFNNHTLFIHSAKTSVSVDEKKNIKEIYMSKKKRTFWCLQNEYIVCWLASKQAIISFCLHLLCCLHLLYYFHLFHRLHLTKSIGPSSASIRSPRSTLFFSAHIVSKTPSFISFDTFFLL